MHCHSFTPMLMSYVPSTERKARLMAANPGNSEVGTPGNPVIETRNPEHLIQENQALRAKIMTMETQMTGVMGVLQALKSGTAAEATALLNSETMNALLPPRLGVNHLVHTPGNITQDGGYHYNMGNHPQGHLSEVPQSNDRIHLLEERLRAMEGSSVKAKDAHDLCLVPNLVIPPKFKVPNFDKYCGTGCPSSHLIMYVRRMSAYAHDDKVLIHYFQDSLTGAPLNWYMKLQPSNIRNWKDLSEAFLKQYQYNMDVTPDRLQLQNMCKRDDESFKEYAQRWRCLATQVVPPLTEKETVSMFVETLPLPYYDRLVGSASSNFSDIVTIGGRIESGIKSGKFNSGLAGLVKEGEANTIATGQRMSYSFPTATQSNKRQRSSKYDLIPMSYTDLCSHLISHNLLSPREMKPVQPPYPKGHNPRATCEFHAGAVGHSAENCYLLRHLVQGLIDTKQLTFTEDGGCQIRNC